MSAARSVAALLVLSGVVDAALLFGKEKPALDIPVYEACAANADGAVTVTPKTTILPAESDWVKGRKDNLGSAWEKYLAQVGGSVADYPNAPIIGVATSGGGYRAMLNGAGVVRALDSRTSKFKSAGILDLATYWAGLSGGNWLAGSMYYHGYPTIDEWAKQLNTSNSLLLPGYDDGGRAGRKNVADYYDEMISVLNATEVNGFNVTLTNYWGLLVMYAVMNWTEQAYNFDVTDIAARAPVKDFASPLPLLVSLQVLNDTNNDAGNPYEWSPFYSGSYANDITAMMKTDLVGSRYNGGQPIDTNSSCAKSMSSLWFAMGTCSSSFIVSVDPSAKPTKPENATASEAEQDSKFAEMVASHLKDVPKGLMSDLAAFLINHTFLGTLLGIFEASYQNPTIDNGEREFSPALFPNPSYGLEGSGLKADNDLYLVDGGLSGLNIPLQPLYVPARKVDVIFAVDSSNDYHEPFPADNSTAYLPGGEAIVAQAAYMQKQGWAFPDTPTQDQFNYCNHTLLQNISFFGCRQTDYPAIVYIPNRLMLKEHNAAFNTYQVQVNKENITFGIDNGYQQLSDEGVNLCIGCLVMYRSNPNATISDQCETCFQELCWTKDTPQPACTPRDSSTTAQLNPGAPSTAAPATQSSSAQASAAPSSTPSTVAPPTQSSSAQPSATSPSTPTASGSTPAASESAASAASNTSSAACDTTPNSRTYILAVAVCVMALAAL